MIKAKISLNWRKFYWLKKFFFNVYKSIFLDERIFFWNTKTFFNLKKFFRWPYIKETFFSVFAENKQTNLTVLINIHGDLF